MQLISILEIKSHKKIQYLHAPNFGFQCIYAGFTSMFNIPDFSVIANQGLVSKETKKLQLKLGKTCLSVDG